MITSLQIRKLVFLSLLFSLSSCGTPVCSTGALERPNLNSPLDFSVVASLLPKLGWTYPNAGCHPQGYRIDLSPDRDFADTSLNGGTGNPDQYWYPGDELADCTTYYWKVFAGIDTTFGPESTTRSFRTNASGTCLPGTGSISGLVFHDLCALPYESISEPPPGCINLGPVDGFGANGDYDPGEPGLPGVFVRSGQGT